MDFIQASAIAYHGALNIKHCVIDSRWLVKLTGFGIDRLPLDPNEQRPEDNQSSTTLFDPSSYSCACTHLEFQITEAIFQISAVELVWNAK